MARPIEPTPPVTGEEAEAVRLAAARVLSSPEEKRAFMLKHGLIDENAPSERRTRQVNKHDSSRPAI